jgi:hypothetical protein
MKYSALQILTLYETTCSQLTATSRYADSVEPSHHPHSVLF